MANSFVKNPLTLQPGGQTLRLVLSNGSVQTQRNIKYPHKYIDKVINEGVQLSEVYDMTEKRLIWKEGKAL